MKKISLVILFLVITCYAQQPQHLIPTDLEQARLGKLKAQVETFQTQLQQIDTQIQALNVLKQLTIEHSQSKVSELQSLSEQVKKAHTEWGDSSKIDYVIANGEYGTFTKRPEEVKQEKK